eukprot:TRINITY_DN774_c0_g1_i2.p1 TRINITY_DN774_c0_g1~~TRINITY_DN774_c0_g1_i2.p1  ORF type:complete len:118 (+),score=17.58 TRINITY_DN774_c0_g1_i2:34-387(+)
MCIRDRYQRRVRGRKFQCSVTCRLGADKKIMEQEVLHEYDSNVVKRICKWLWGHPKTVLISLILIIGILILSVLIYLEYINPDEEFESSTSSSTSFSIDSSSSFAASETNQTDSSTF